MLNLDKILPKRKNISKIELKHTESDKSLEKINKSVGAGEVEVTKKPLDDMIIHKEDK